MTRAELYAHALLAREQVATWQGCDLRGQPADVRAAVLSVRYHAGELVDLLRARLTDDELDEAHRLAWPPLAEPTPAQPAPQLLVAP